MKKEISAGLLMYRVKDDQPEVFLVHPGGPYFRSKDYGFWGIPKGLLDDEKEDILDAAKREFKEETGIEPKQPFNSLGNVVRDDGKTIHAWSFEGDLVPDFQIASNTLEIEWPPRSEKTITIPEVDRGEFFTIENAKFKITPSQWPFVERLIELIKK